MKKEITIGCVGMTHLGLIHTVAFATKGFNLIGYDNDAVLINQLSKGNLLVNEPQLEELLKDNSARLQFTNNINSLHQADVVFIAYDVPTDDKGNSEIQVIYQLIDKVIPHLSNKASLVILSQVPPGYTRQINFDKNRVFYQVETLIFGRAIDRALYPERYIVGAYAPENALPDAYLDLLSSFNCPILQMQYESAELAKISINMFLVSSVSTTNTLAEICEVIGADWEEIAPALRLDKRIGQFAYLSPGLGIAGGNLERDLNTICKLGQTHNADVGVVNAWLHNSRYRRDWVLRCLQENVFKNNKQPVICILGLAYKPDTHSIKNSPSIALINQLKDYQIKAHDPVVEELSIANLKQEKNHLRAIEDADVLVIMTPWAEYKKLSCIALKQQMRGNTIIDPFGVLKNSNQENMNYFCLGQPTKTMVNKELNYA